jgi:hypothetical protein
LYTKGIHDGSGSETLDIMKEQQFCSLTAAWLRDSKYLLNYFIGAFGALIFDIVISGTECATSDAYSSLSE